MTTTVAFSPNRILDGYLENISRISLVDRLRDELAMRDSKVLYVLMY